MITKRKGKYLLITLLLLIWAAGLVVFMQFEKYVVVNAKNFGIGFAKPEEEAKRTVAVPVLLYHGVVKQEDGSNITVANFEQQMLALKENGYTTIDIDDLFAFYKQEAKLPPKPIVITFDDGRRDSFVNSDGILEGLGFKAIMFVVTEKQDNKDDFFLTWDELQQMHDSGRWDIEAHAYKGHDLIQIDGQANSGSFFGNKMWLPEENRLESDEEYEDRVRTDLQTAKGDLEKNIEGIEVTAFSFPFGDYGKRSLNIEGEIASQTFLDILRGIYPLSFELNLTGSDFNNFEDSDCNLLRRYEIHSDLSAEALISKLQHSSLKELPYDVPEFSPDELSHWFCNWGKVFTDNGRAILTNKDHESGGEFVLYGGHYWENYYFQADVSLEGGKATLIGRYADDDNFVYCGLSDSGIIVGQKVQGEDMTLEYVRLDKPQAIYGVELEFAGDTLTCRLNGEAICDPVSFNPDLGRGGVGFQVWNGDGGVARLAVRNVAIIEIKD